MRPRLATARTKPGGGFKVYIWKQASGHLMDWAGCNFRLVSVPGQPRFGFDRRELAEEWARIWFTRGGNVTAIAAASDGTHLSEHEEGRDMEPVEGL
jgi:hypothetical protein